MAQHDMDAIFAMLNSPSVMKYLQSDQVQSAGIYLEQQSSTFTTAVVSSSQVTPEPAPEIQSLPSTSRVNAPFSPERVTVTRYGQRYHMEVIPEPVSIEAPLVHIPDTVPVTTDHSDDPEYARFLQRVMTNESVDEKAPDPTYFAPKKVQLDDDNVPPVPQREKDRLIEDLMQNPIPGFSLELTQLEKEPPIITRAARQRISDPQLQHMAVPSTSSGPVINYVSEPIPSGVQTRQQARNSTGQDVIAAGPISGRTRQALAKTPVKNNEYGAFRAPMPTSSPRGKPKTPRRQSRETVDHPVDERAVTPPNQTGTVGVPSNNALSPSHRDKLRNLGKKVANFLQYDNVSIEQKEIFEQLVEHAMSQFAEDQSVSLIDFLLRTAALVCGHLGASQFAEVFNRAKSVNSGFAHIAFALLVHDRSSLILQIAPFLYGKTELVKRLRRRFSRTADPALRVELVKAFMEAFYLNDHPSQRRNSPISGSIAWNMLEIDGSEGLIDDNVLEYLPMEMVDNPEELLAHYQEAERTRAANHASTGQHPQPTHQLPVMSNLDISRLLDGLDNSNSFNIMQDSPANPLDQNGATHSRAAGLPNSGPDFVMSPVTPHLGPGAQQVRPRRIQLVSAPLLGSPNSIHTRRHDFSGVFG